MSEKSYFKIGIFVITGTIILIVGIIIFGGGDYFKDKVVIETYFSQSVEGMSVGSPLKLQGVPIGRVTHIGFVFNHYRTDYTYVYVEAEIYTSDVGGRHGLEEIELKEKFRRLSKNIKEGINVGLRLELTPQGITGLAFLNAVYLDPKTHPPLIIDWKPHHQYIPSAPGAFTQITQAIEKLTSSIDQIDLPKLVMNIEQLIANLNKSVIDAKVKEISEDLRAALVQFNEVGEKVNSILNSKELTDSIRDLSVSMENIKDTTNKLPETVDEINKGLIEAKDYISTKERNITTIFENLQSITQQLNEFSNTLNNYPSWVIFGDPPPRIQKEEDK